MLQGMKRTDIWRNPRVAPLVVGVPHIVEVVEGAVMPSVSEEVGGRFGVRECGPCEQYGKKNGQVSQVAT